MILPYTLEKLFTQEAVLERDACVLDELGGEPKAEREVIGSVECRFWWWKIGTSRGGVRELATAQRTVEFAGGGMIVPLGTDIRDGFDHVKEVLENGKTVFVGPLRVVGVIEYEAHIEVPLMRP